MNMMLINKDELQKHYSVTKEANHRRVCKRIQFIKVENKQNYIHIHTYMEYIYKIYIFTHTYIHR